MDQKKKEMLKISKGIQSDACEQHAMETQMSLSGFDWELQDRIEERIASIKKLTKKLSEVYGDYVSEGGDRENLDEIFSELCNLGILEEDMHESIDDSD